MESRCVSRRPDEGIATQFLTLMKEQNTHSLPEKEYLFGFILEFVALHQVTPSVLANPRLRKRGVGSRGGWGGGWVAWSDL